MKYKCRKCGELYDEKPLECDFDEETEFLETEICENCGEYKVIYGKYCKECIQEKFTNEIGQAYIESLDEKRKEWGLEPFFKDEYAYLSSKQNNKNFLWEYCSDDLEGLGNYIFEGVSICSEN